MELEELGELLNNNTERNIPNDNAAIRKSTAGPLSAFAKKLRFTLIAFPLAAVLFTAQFLDDAAARHSPTKWILVTVLFVEFLLAIFNYIIVKNIGNTEGNIKQNILNKFALIKNAYTVHLYLHLFLYAMMAVALELTMRYRLDINFEGWSTVAPILRIAVYMGFLIVQYFLRRISYKRYYGRYLEKIQQLALQLEY
ncbi:MAG: hypothetical protein JWR50_519 [Mucilaginibacter sp.]|nr:hypothetical protein [Mucilaginibacter sp.]